jgi:hypothetical protein
MLRPCGGHHHQVSFKFIFNFILPPIAMTSDLSLVFWFHHQNTVYISFLPHKIKTPCHFVLLNLINWTAFCEVYKSQSSSLGSFLQSPIICSFLSPNIIPSLFLKHPQPVFFKHWDWPSPILRALPTMWPAQFQTECSSHNVTGPVPNRVFFP